MISIRVSIATTASIIFFTIYSYKIKINSTSQKKNKTPNHIIILLYIPFFTL